MKNKKQHARKLYSLLPFGQKIKFCEMLADRFDVSTDYVIQSWFHSDAGVPNKYIDETLKLLQDELR